MIPVRRYMDEAAERGIVKNDSDLARRLGVTRQSVSAWRTGESFPDSDQAAALADLLGKPEVLAECMAARAKRPETRAIWERAARTLSMTMAFCAAVAVNFFLTPSPANASNGAETRCCSLYYVNLRITPRNSISSSISSSVRLPLDPTSRISAHSRRPDTELLPAMLSAPDSTAATS